MGSSSSSNNNNNRKEEQEDEKKKKKKRKKKLNKTKKKKLKVKLWPLVTLSAYEPLIPPPLPSPLLFPLPTPPPPPPFALSLSLSPLGPFPPSPPFSLCSQQLLDSKLRIMSVRMRYGLDAWTLAAQIVNPYETLPCVAAPSAALNRAFFKMWELLRCFPLVPPADRSPRFLSAHLCEGPGGFVQAVLKYRERCSAGDNGVAAGEERERDASLKPEESVFQIEMQDSWFAMTLAKEHARAGDDFEMQKTKLQKAASRLVEGHVYYGVDGSGDITNPVNISSFVEYVLRHSHGAKMELITADGAFDVSDDFALQEQNHSLLVFCEMVTAFKLQAAGGSFVLKLFDCFTETTAAVIFILTSLYTNVEIVRLRTSRVCNSERFVVAQGFRGLMYGLEARLMDLVVEWNEAMSKGRTTSVAVSDGLSSSFLEALASSNACIVDDEIGSIDRAVFVAEDIGERLSCIEVPGTRKGIISILRRKLKTLQKLQSAANVLFEALDIPFPKI